MKHTTASVIVLACMVVVLSITNAFTAVSSASAQLGNTAVPVTCHVYNLALTTPWDLPCHPGDGTSLGPNYSVPSGHYFLVTDVSLVPNGPTSGYWWAQVVVIDNGGYSLDWVDITTSTKANASDHFGAPILILKAGDRLRAFNRGESSGTVSIVVTGFLTTNISYLPMITK